MALKCKHSVTPRSRFDFDTIYNDLHLIKYILLVLDSKRFSRLENTLT